jgi:hypothetical protein
MRRSSSGFGVISSAAGVGGFLALLLVRVACTRLAKGSVSVAVVVVGWRSVLSR